MLDGLFNIVGGGVIPVLLIVVVLVLVVAYLTIGQVIDRYRSQGGVSAGA